MEEQAHHPRFGEKPGLTAAGTAERDLGVGNTPVIAHGRTIALSATGGHTETPLNRGTDEPTQGAIANVRKLCAMASGKRG
jgi:hypothetical protein